MDRHEVKNLLKNSSHKQNLKGELKVSMDGESVIYPADSFTYNSTWILMIFGKRESSGAVEHGVAFSIHSQDYGKEITFPDNPLSYIYLISNDEYYEPKSGTLTVNYDIGNNLAFGSFDVVMEPDSPISKLKDGIFSVNEVK